MYKIKCAKLKCVKVKVENQMHIKAYEVNGLTMESINFMLIQGMKSHSRIFQSTEKLLMNFE